VVWTDSLIDHFQLSKLRKMFGVSQRSVAGRPRVLPTPKAMPAAGIR
jgi:hypothetical protein